MNGQNIGLMIKIEPHRFMGVWRCPEVSVATFIRQIGLNIVINAYHINSILFHSKGTPQNGFFGSFNPNLYFFTTEMFDRIGVKNSDTSPRSLFNYPYRFLIHLVASMSLTSLISMLN